MEGNARILVYGFSAEEQRRIDEGLASLGVPPALKARPEQGGEVLRRILAGESPAAAAEAAGVGGRKPLVLFHNISDSGVRALLGFFREAARGRPRVSTPTSLDWTLEELVAHLEQERAALEEGR
ncbi:MAG: hypothetical protein A2064_11050 [Spirochaetes bacterium GWB1_66_5]|nr:MAG: hypothetical protein A2064_11050 [Spirochaetes bacterium GWB1_66_5]